MTYDQKRRGTETFFSLYDGRCAELRQVELDKMCCTPLPAQRYFEKVENVLLLSIQAGSFCISSHDMSDIRPLNTLTWSLAELILLVNQSPFRAVKALFIEVKEAFVAGG